jgi:hypothetical protein
MDQNNPARTALTSIPPALLADMANDPKLLRNIAMPMVAMQLDALHRLTLNPNLPTGQRIQIADFTAKIADAYPKASAPTAGAGQERFVLNINMGSNTKPETITVEAKEVTNAS